MDDNDLKSILNDEPTTDTTPTETEEAQEARLRDERGRFASASDPGDETPEAPAPEAAPPAAQQDTEQGHIPVAALRDERQKRQQLEAQLQQYEQLFAQYQQPQQPYPAQQAEIPDMYVDPEGYTRWIAASVRDQIMQEVDQKADQFGTMTRAQVDEMMARQKYPDYDDKLAVIREAAATNPAIVQEIYAAPQPAEKAMQIASNILAARQLGSATLPSRDDLKAELRAELMAEFGLSSTPKAPSSLASEGSVASRSGTAWAGPPSLDDLLR